MFTPFDSGTNAYISWLENHCRYSLLVADYSLTNRKIVQEYLNLAQRGVKISIILDTSEFKQIKSEAAIVQRLSAAGINVIITTSPKAKALMHLKMSIVDGQYVESGSWNYTNAADNQCNVLELDNVPNPSRADAFIQAWQQIYNYARP